MTRSGTAPFQWESLLCAVSPDGAQLLGPGHSSNLAYGSGGFLDFVFRHAARELFGVIVSPGPLPFKRGRNPDFEELVLEVRQPASSVSDRWLGIVVVQLIQLDSHVWSRCSPLLLRLTGGGRSCARVCESVRFPEHQHDRH